jgi:hypothetical protein
MMLAWINIQARVPLDHPLRSIRKLHSPKRLLKASLLVPL